LQSKEFNRTQNIWGSGKLKEKYNSIPSWYTRIGYSLVILILLFYAGRIGKIAWEIGGGIKAFREGIQKDEQD
jgi:hypothetical protein